MTVYLSEPIAPAAYERLAARFALTDRFDEPEKLDAIVTRGVAVPGDVIRRGTRLKVIVVHGVGTDSVDMDAAREMGVPVRTVPGAGTESVAELTVGLFLALARKLKSVDRGLRAGRFSRLGEPALLGTELFGKKLGVVGAGSIACRTAEIMRAAFGCEAYCYHPRRTAEELAALGLEKADTLEDLFARMDLVSVHVPLTEETWGMIGRAQFAAANRKLLFVNTARGGVADEQALYEALTGGQIAAAASDVFVKEPPDRDAPLLALDNFIGTFHVGVTTAEALDRLGDAVADHVIRALCPEDTNGKDEKL